MIAAPGADRSRQMRRAAVVAGLFLALLVVVPSAPVGPAVPLLVPLALAGLLIVFGSARHGVVIVVVAAMLIPQPFSVKVGPVSLTVGRALLFTLVAGWFLALKRADRPILPRRTPIDPMIGVFVATMLAATIANLDRYGPGELLGALRRTGVFVVDYFLLFFIAVSVMRSLDRANRIVSVLAATVGLMGAIGLIEHVTGQNVFVYVAPVLPGGIGQFIRDLAETTVLTRGTVSRVRSTAEGPLPFGILLVLGLPLALSFALRVQKRGPRVFWALATGAIGMAMILNASRSVYALAAVTFATFLVLLQNRRQRIGLALAGLVLTGAFLSQKDVRDTMLTFFQPERPGGIYEGSVQARVEDYRPVIGRVTDRPFLGYGPRSFSVDALLQNKLLDNPGNLVLDNAYLLQVAEGGLIGLLALIALLVAAYSAAWRALRRARSPDEYLIRLGLFTAVQGWILMGLVADVYQFNAAPKVFFVLLAAVAVHRIESGWVPPIGAPRAAGGRPGLGAPARPGAGEQVDDEQPGSRPSRAPARSTP